MSGYLQRQTWAQETRDDRPCPRCSHRIGSHRGMPGECTDPDCSCVISFDDLTKWRKEGKV